MDYKIDYDQGTSNWIELVSGLTSKDYLATSLTANTIYSFKVYSRNAVGFSDPSSSVGILAAAVPDKPNAPTSSINSDQVNFVWTAPYNGGSDITEYKI